MIRRVASVLLAGASMTPWASAQAPAGQPGSLPPAPAPASTNAHANAPLFPPVPTDPAHPNYNAAAHRSIVRHNPLPHATTYRAHYPYQSRAGSSSSSTSGDRGFANPGGVGRYAEYYDANTPTSQVDLHPVPVGRFDSGGGPDRAEQISAAQAGQQRARNIQDNINAYGRPYGAFGYGFGYGLGLSGGTLYNYPF